MDFYIPEIRVAIEYDKLSDYHIIKKWEEDITKSVQIISKDITLIKIREIGLPLINHEHIQVINKLDDSNEFIVDLLYLLIKMSDYLSISKQGLNRLVTCIYEINNGSQELFNIEDNFPSEMNKFDKSLANLFISLNKDNKILYSLVRNKLLVIHQPASNIHENLDDRNLLLIESKNMAKLMKIHEIELRTSISMNYSNSIFIAHNRSIKIESKRKYVFDYKAIEKKLGIDFRQLIEQIQ